jgi:hypothetical protein
MERQQAAQSTEIEIGSTYLKSLSVDLGELQDPVQFAGILPTIGWALKSLLNRPR